MEATPEIRELAWRLLAHEAGEGLDPVRLAHGTEMACQKLRGRLVAVMGTVGFQAVLARALRLTALACPEPSVDLAVVDPILEQGPILEGLRECVQGGDPVEVKAALTGLFANVLAVLVGLMGSNLIYEFLRAAWPDVRID